MADSATTVVGALGQRPSERDDLGQCGRDAVADRADELLHHLASLFAVRSALGLDHALVDTPGGLNLDVLIDGEQLPESVFLLVGEQVSARV